MKKIIRKNKVELATRKFTDREEPRKVFWDKYRELEQNIKNVEDIYVINYYGVGGIGKSSLLRQIVSELKENEAYYCLYDFETAQDPKTVLSLIKKKLEESYKFDFPIFDLALYCYARKIGEDPAKPEVKSLVEKSRTLSFILNTVNDIPVVGLASSIFKWADEGLAVLKNNSNKYKKDLEELENEEPQDTYNRLPYYFAQDLAANMEKLDKPLVILLDTYEKLVNEVKSEGYALMQDYWLRNDDGPIVQVPGVLWVIAGREKIKWGENDKDWNETLDQHILGDLSFDDANDFLKEAGIVEESLRNDIYNLTNGTPVYLDICVSTYEYLKNNDEKISIDKFGNDVDILVERLIRYMDNQSSEITYMLSVIGNWDDDLIFDIGPKILPSFSISLYEKIKNLSYIIRENDKYYMHQTVRNIFKKKCPIMLANKTLENMNIYYLNYIVDHDVLDDNYVNCLDSYTNVFLEYTNSENLNQQVVNLDAVLYSIDYSLDKKKKEILDRTYSYIIKNFPKCEYLYCLELQYAGYYLYHSDFKSSIEKCYETIDKLINERILDYDNMLNISNYLRSMKGIVNINKVNEFINFVNIIPVPGNNDNAQSLLLMLANLSFAKNDYETAIKYYDQADSEMDKNMRFLMLTEILLTKLNNETLSEREKEYAQELEELFNDELNDDVPYGLGCLALARYSILNNDNDKALYWIEKGDDFYQKQEKEREDNSYLSYMVSKALIIHSIDCNEGKEYSKYVLDYINNNCDLDDSTIELSLIQIYSIYSLEEENKLLLKLCDKYGKKEKSLEQLSIISNFLNRDIDEEIINKMVDFCTNDIVIEEDDVNENNLALFDNLIKNLLKYTDNIEQQLDLNEQLLIAYMQIQPTNINNINDIFDEIISLNLIVKNYEELIEFVSGLDEVFFGINRHSGVLAYANFLKRNIDKSLVSNEKITEKAEKSYDGVSTIRDCVYLIKALKMLNDNNFDKSIDTLLKKVLDNINLVNDQELYQEIIDMEEQNKK